MNKHKWGRAWQIIALIYLIITVFYKDIIENKDIALIIFFAMIYIVEEIKQSKDT